MADAAPTRQMTADEFLRWDDGGDTRYELVHGRPVAMAPAADRHGRIAGNVWGEIDRRLAERPPCCGIVEGGVWIDDAQLLRRPTWSPPAPHRPTTAWSRSRS